MTQDQDAAAVAKKLTRGAADAMPDPAVIAAIKTATFYRERATEIETRAAYEHDSMKRAGSLHAASGFANLARAFERFATEMQKAVDAELEEGGA